MINYNIRDIIFSKIYKEYHLKKFFKCILELRANIETYILTAEHNRHTFPDDYFMRFKEGNFIQLYDLSNINNNQKYNKMYINHNKLIKTINNLSYSPDKKAYNVIVGINNILNIKDKNEGGIGTQFRGNIYMDFLDFFDPVPYLLRYIPDSGNVYVWLKDGSQCDHLNYLTYF